MPPIAVSHSLPLPRGWPRRVRSAIVQVISLARASLALTQGWASESMNRQLRRRANEDHLKGEIQLLREEIPIKDARMEQIDAHKRPHYPPTQRLAILEARAARGWSLAQTARTFLVTPLTIASWMGRLDEEGPDALLRLPEPVNEFPDFVCYIVKRLKILCPTLGKVKTAQILARAGLHLAPTSVRRMLRDKELPGPARASEKFPRLLAARHANHLACGFDQRSHGARFLDFLASLCFTSGLALLLVGCHGRRSFLPALDGIRGLPDDAVLRCGSKIPGACVPKCRRHAGSPRL
ncbi:MAG TPA: helix-turn-helix domain-containing protein [Candidatus Polarisedimenticolia bacterium]|nr:helix-turn-helix domain-containing protein [Candidatus Polarisedimenticolia bacterium]